MDTQVTRILLVEDNPGDAQLLRLLLKETRAAYELQQAGRLSEAITAIEQDSFDIVLLDLSLPDSHGLENVKRLCAAASLPIVIMTGLEDEAVALQAVQAGAQDYLIKGHVDSGLLQRAIRYAIERFQTVQALRVSEARFASFMRYLPGIAFMKDMDGRYLYANENFAEILQSRKAEWRQKTDDDIWPPELAAHLRRHDSQVLMTRSVLQQIEVIPQYEGPHHWLVSKFPILDAEQKPVMVGGVAVDITERRRAERALLESENRLRFITGHIAEAVLIYGLDRKLQYVNQAFEPLTGYSIDELYEQNFIPYQHPEDRERLMALLETVYHGASFANEVHRIITKDGRLKYCASSWSPLVDEEGQQIGIQGTEADVTAQYA